jgi:hypothetical protein
MRIYIAGPMLGCDHYNFDAFDAKRDEIRALGHIPVSPADLDRAIGFDPYDRRSVESIPIDAAFMKSTVRRDVDAIIECDALVLLDGWQNSAGATGEVAVARWLGIPVFLPTDSLPEAA